MRWRRVETTPARKARVEMIPLIDAMFLLLTFFVYAVLSMTIHKGLPVLVPEAVTAVREQVKEIVLTLPAEGEEVFVNKDKMLLSDVADYLRALSLNKSGVTVLINADEASRHGRVIRLLDAVRLAGVEDVAFQVEGLDP